MASRQAENLATWPDVDRRKGLKDRRISSEDRRNEDRVADDPLPRRNPDVPDRRKH